MARVETGKISRAEEVGTSMLLYRNSCEHKALDKNNAGAEKAEADTSVIEYLNGKKDEKDKIRHGILAENKHWKRPFQNSAL